jgi:hypothetical protein
MILLEFSASIAMNALGLFKMMSDTFFFSLPHPEAAKTASFLPGSRQFPAVRHLGGLTD